MPNTMAKRTECSDCPIRHRAVCSRCEQDELEALNAMKSYRSFAPGETLAWAGEEIEFVGSVVSGAASLSQTMEDGRRQMVGLLLPSDFIGRPGRDSVGLRRRRGQRHGAVPVRKARVRDADGELSTVSKRLLEMTLDELDAARDWMLILGRKTARERLASFLSIVAGRCAAASGPSALDGGIAFDLPLTREAIADYLGLTIETVSRQFSALRKDGVIELQGKRRVLVPDRGALLGESGDDSDGGVYA